MPPPPPSADWRATGAPDFAHGLARLAPEVAAALQRETVFLTGGTGFFGRTLLEFLCQANDSAGWAVRLKVLSRAPADFLRRVPHLARPDIEWLAGDARDYNPAETGRARYFLHMATETVPASHPAASLQMFETCVDGTRNALRLADRLGTRRFLLASSGMVYGSQPASLETLPEDHPGAPDPLRPQSAYAEGKRAAELLCAIWPSLHPPFEPVIARGFAFVGPHLPRDAHFAAGNFLRDAIRGGPIRGGPIRVSGDGKSVRSYLHSADLVVWLLTLLVRGTAGRAYNVGSDVAVTIAELARLTAEAAGLPAGAVEVGPGPSSFSRYVPSLALARRELGLQVWIPLREALDRTLRAIRRAPSPSSPDVR